MDAQCPEKSFLVDFKTNFLLLFAYFLLRTDT